jgi:outer membrane protein OmpA-like peptidoglycan-associated protein
MRGRDAPLAGPLRAASWLLVAGVAVVAWAAPATGQRFPGLGGGEARAGLVFPENANVAAGTLAELDLGYVWAPPLRILVGVGRFEANIDREGGGDEGSFRATGIWAGGRYDLMTRNTLAPYVRGGLTLQRVRADAFDQDVGALLQGTYVGLAGAVGARYLLDPWGRLSATAELRRVAVTNVAHTALELGLRLQLRGYRAYIPEAVALVDPRAGPPGPQPVRPAPATFVRDTVAERRLAELEEIARELERALAELRVSPTAPASPVAVVADPPREAAGVEAMLRQSVRRAAGAMASITDLEETGEAFVLTLAGSAFPSGSAQLAAAAREETRVLATVLAGYPRHIVLVHGHTDSAGDAAANQVLSERRAAGVRAALIAEGVDPLWIGSRGFGELHPVTTDETAAGRAMNRRVEVRVSKADCPTTPVTGPGGVLECRL